MNAFLRPRRRSVSSTNRVSNVSLLETRILPAGNVQINFDAVTGDLTIEGDNRSNSVQVLYDGADVRVRGLDGTRIGGGTADFVIAGTDTLNSVSVNLQRGNDLFYISGGVQVTTTLGVQPGAGNDTTVIRDAGVGNDIYVGIPFGLANDPGNDRVAIVDTTAENIFVSTGDGHDVAQMLDVVAADSIMVQMGAGNDLFGGSVEATEDFTAAMGSGNDVLFASITAGGVAIDLEAGDDLLQLFEIDQNDPTRLASINLGRGNDRATVGAGMLGGVGFDSFLAVTGSSGNDRFYLMPGATLSDGFIVLEVESTAPYLVYADPATQKQYSGVFRRAQDFGDFLATLP